MNFEWTTNDIAVMNVSIYETNLTLNKAACRHFEDVNYVLLGIDRDTKQIGIKPVSKEQIDEGIYPKSQLHRISLGKSYGRITNKAFVEGLSQYAHLDFTSQQCYKYQATYDVIHSVMVINL